MFVVKHAVAMEHVCFPLTLVCDFSAGIVKHPFSLHSVLDPLSAVLSALFVVKGAESMSEFAYLIALVSSFLQLLADIPRIVLIIKVQLPLGCVAELSFGCVVGDQIFLMAE